MIPESEWLWSGYAEHFIGAADCRFSMATAIGEYVVSTVGEYFPTSHKGDDPRPIGAERTYETFVFKAGPTCGKCPFPHIADATEIEAEPANDAAAAHANHMTMCRKYAKAGVLIGGTSE